MEKIYDQFTGKYPVSKTLCFELIPQGATLEHMKENGILEEDEHRSQSYEKVKALIDRCHKAFIDEVLSDLCLEGLEEYAHYFKLQERTEKEELMLINLQESLRKQISDSFKNHPKYKKMFGKTLHKEILPEICDGEEERCLLEEFNGFTSYFSGHDDNRRYIYSEEGKVSSIAYRLIHENLPIFIENIELYDAFIHSAAGTNISAIQKDHEMHCPENSIEKFFVLKNFNLTLTQKGITQYNAVVSGFNSGEGKMVNGINDYIYHYNQKATKKIGLLKKLNKQILSDQQTIAFSIDKFESDNKLLQAINEYMEKVSPIIANSMMHLLLAIHHYDLGKIYIQKKYVSDISQKIYGDWKTISEAVCIWYDQQYSEKLKIGTKNYENEKERYLKKKKSFSISFLNECCKNMKDIEAVPIESYYERYCNADKMNFGLVFVNSYEKYISHMKNTSTKKRIAKQQKTVEIIKNLLDCAVDFRRYLQSLVITEDGLEYDHEFYDNFMPLYLKIHEIESLYNKCRNYLTQKTYSKEKIKLNFSAPTLLSGWSLSKEKENLAVILRKDELYYLGIINKNNRKIFEGERPSDGCVYEKMEYRLLPGANKMLPKIFLASKNSVDKYQPSEEVLRIYNTGTFKKGKDFSLEDCHTLIDYFKECIEKREEWSKFGFVFSDTDSYADISGFYREVESQGYKIEFRKISGSYIDGLVAEGKLYLFQIYNKDFSPYSKGIPNLHTMYFRELFSSENLETCTYKLNGNADIFYRKKSIDAEDIITHPANIPIANKNPLNKKKESRFPYTIYKDRRYMEDKFLFHVPITLNFNVSGEAKLNSDVNKILKYKEVYVIGINRGERNLLYVSVIDPKGNIVEQFSFNEIINRKNDGSVIRTNYYNLIEEKAKERSNARENWDTIENIRNIKEGYLSQAIHEIIKLMMQYQAILVIDDLDSQFNRQRQCIEKNIYQKFITMLLEKLNYLVDKKADRQTMGGIHHAYQLTNKLDSVKKIGKQNGFVFFAPTYYITTTDPTTGFVNFIFPKYKNVEESKDFFDRFDSIFFDKENNYFCFETDFSKFTDKTAGTKEKWIICSQGSRTRFCKTDNKKKPVLEIQYPTELLKKLFNKYNIQYDKGNIKEQILSQTEKGFFKEFMEILTLVLKMRNYAKDTDYIISPVKNKNGEFFDSRDGIAGLPVNADANAAYNIARKGLMMLQRIKETEDDQLGKVRLAISNAEWLKFAQKQ